MYCGKNLPLCVLYCSIRYTRLCYGSKSVTLLLNSALQIAISIYFNVKEKSYPKIQSSEIQVPQNLNPKNAATDLLPEYAFFVLVV